MKRFFMSFLLLGIACFQVAVADEAMQAQTSKQTFAELMRELSNWGRWGEDDEKGSLNLITAKKRVEAARLVKKGVSVSLAHPLEKKLGPRNYHPLHHEMNILSLSPTSVVSTDRIAISYHGIVHSHLDALCHIFHDEKMYNGFPQAEVTAEGCFKNAVTQAKNGILTRGVLIDFADLYEVQTLQAGYALKADDFERWALKTGTQIKPGDALFIRTGRWRDKTEQLAFAGLDVSAVKWLKGKDIAIIGSDTSLEVWPSRVEGEFIPIHKLIMVSMGMMMFDNLDLSALSEEAKKQDRWDFFSRLRHCVWMGALARL